MNKTKLTRGKKNVTIKKKENYKIKVFRGGRREKKRLIFRRKNIAKSLSNYIVKISERNKTTVGALILELFFTSQGFH